MFVRLYVGELKELVEEGKVKYIGLSVAIPNTIRRAHDVPSIIVVQIEWYLWTRDIEDEIVPLCRTSIKDEDVEPRVYQSNQKNQMQSPNISPM
ncbi:hypothetical protein RYX36_034641 [Vicia faba]